MGMIRRVPHCSHWGAYTLLVDDDNIVGIEPHAADANPSSIVHSTSHWADSDLRVLRPMVREGWLADRHRSDGARRGRDRFIPLGWDEAAELVTGEIDRVRSQFGNEAIFAGSYGWTSCGRFHHAATLLKRFLNLLGGYVGHKDNYSLAAGPVITRHVLGSDESCYGQGSSLESIAEHTETLVIFGSIAPRTAQNEAGGINRHTLEDDLAKFTQRDMRVILVSPVRSDVPDYLDAEWWSIRPHTDAALMLGLAGEIVASGRHDRHFLERCCSGADRLLAYLDGSTDSVVKNASWAAGITDLDAEKIRILAKRLVDTRSMLSVSWSLQRAQHGEQHYWASLALACISGQVGLPGGGVSYGLGSTAGMGGRYGAGKAPGMSQGQKPVNRDVPVARISDMLLNPGANYHYEGEVRTYPDIRLIYWAGGNPYHHHHQDLRRLEHAWARPETIVVQDPMWTPTVQRADIVLPASTSLERNDIAGTKRMDQVVAMHKAIEPRGDARSDFEIFNDLAVRMGVGPAFNEGRNEMGWIRHLYDSSRQHAAAELGFEMLEFETFWHSGFADVPVQTRHTFLESYRKDPQSYRLDTESGRIVLGSEKLAALNYADCPAHPAWIEPAEWLGNGFEDQLHLVSNQPAGKLHSQLDTGVASMACKRNGREQALISRGDAERYGVSDGQTVCIWNSRGACLATATVTDDVRTGVIVLATGAWLTQVGNSHLDIAGNPNVLTLDIGSSQFSQGCSAYTCLVRIEPYLGGTLDAASSYQRRLAAMGAI